MNPDAPDAPIIQLLSLRHGTLTKDMTNEQLATRLAMIQKLVAQPASLTAALQSESDAKKPRVGKAKSLLADI